MAQTTLEIIRFDVSNTQLAGLKTSFALKTPWHCDTFPKPLRPHTIKLPLWKDGHFLEYIFWNEQVRQGKVPIKLDVYVTTDDNAKVNHELFGTAELNLFDYVLDFEAVNFQNPLRKVVKILSKSTVGNNNVIGYLTIRITMVLWPATNKRFQSNRNWLLQQVQLSKTTMDVEQAINCEAKKENCHPESQSEQKSKVKGKVAFCC